MKAIDMTNITRNYPGYFVALSHNMRKVFGKGHIPEEALKEAKKKGCKNPVLTKIPGENRSYLL